MTTNHTSTIPTADILVVDDTIDSLKSLTNILTQAGYRVRPAAGPQEALESALAHPPDLILLDVKMPEMSGFELCRRLKQDERTVGIPVIFVSALQDLDDQVQGFKVGGVDFVSKPFQEAEVLARVKTHLQLRTMQLYLEALVAERTTELIKANEALQKEITERKRAEEELRLFKGIIVSSQEAVAISDPDGNLVYINPAHERLFGRSLAEARQCNYRNYYPPESIRVLDETVAPTLARGESWEGELDAFDADGRRFPLWERADTVRDEAGHMLYGFGFMHDITERKLRKETEKRLSQRIEAGLQAGNLAW